MNKVATKKLLVLLFVIVRALAFLSCYSILLLLDCLLNAHSLLMLLVVLQYFFNMFEKGMRGLVCCPLEVGRVEND